MRKELKLCLFEYDNDRISGKLWRINLKKSKKNLARWQDAKLICKTAFRYINNQLEKTPFKMAIKDKILRNTFKKCKNFI